VKEKAASPSGHAGHDMKEAVKPAPDAIDAHVKHMESMLAELKTLRAATTKFYAALTPEQKTKADKILAFNCPMMGGMHE
jgi:hypothetical protein